MKPLYFLKNGTSNILMAIYHFSGTVISRSQGRSAVACAAYRAAARLQDNRYGKIHDYTQKDDVAYVEILLPTGAPVWMQDRERLWNAVEQFEKRKDAQLAREFHLALPQELTMAQNIELAHTFVEEAFVRQGMVADVCLHDHRTVAGEPQPHAHVMLTLRAVSGEGFGPKVRSWNSKAQLLAWRAAWANAVNRQLALYGHDLQVDHRTLAAQGIELEPQYKRGATVVRQRLARFADHQRIARENGERLFADPTIALEALTMQQSTFTHQDLARLVNRQTVDAEQFERVYTKVKGAPELVSLGTDAQHRERLTTQGMLALEQTMVARSERLAERCGHEVEERALMQALAGYSLTDEQRWAFDYMTQGRGLSSVVGYAGTGKSTVLGAARTAWEAQGYQVLGATLSGIAAENLKGSSGIESRTLASRFYYWDRGEQLLGPRDVLVVDEAGMIGSRQMAQLVEQVEQSGAQLVLVGDPEQLQAMAAGAAFRAIVERVGAVELTTIRRQQVDWQQDATRELATGQTALALKQYQAHHHLHAFETQALAQKALIAHWHEDRISHPYQSQIILTYLRQEVRILNELARQLRREQGELGREQVFQTHQGARALAEQDRVYFLKNDRDLGVMNGTLGTIIGLQGSQLHIRLDQDERQPQRMMWVDTERYPYLDHGYAATIHKAQGVTVDRSYVLAAHYLDRHATYVALSRHRASMELFYSREVFAQDQDLLQAFSRERSKDTSLDYGMESNFAAQRGIEDLSERQDRIWVPIQEEVNDQTLSGRALKAAELNRLPLDDEAQYAEKSQRSTVHFDARSEASLEALWKRYVAMQLEQTRLLNELHRSYLQADPSLKKACSERVMAHDQQLIAFAKEAMKRADVGVLAAQLQLQRTRSIADLGGFESIAQRLKEGSGLEPDHHALTRHLQSKANDRSWSRARSQDRGGGRSR